MVLEDNRSLGRRKDVAFGAGHRGISGFSGSTPFLDLGDDMFTL